MGREAGAGSLNLKVDQVGRALQQKYDDSQIARILVELLTAAFALTLHFLERGKNHAKQLYHNRSRDVGHDSEGKDRCLREGATREHVEKLHQACAVCELRQGIEVFRRDARKHDIATQAVDKYQQQGNQKALAELLDGPDIF